MTTRGDMIINLTDALQVEREKNAQLHRLLNQVILMLEGALSDEREHELLNEINKALADSGGHGGTAMTLDYQELTTYYMNRTVALEAQIAQLRAALERLINVPAKDTKAVDEAWDLARQVLADSRGMET